MRGGPHSVNQVILGHHVSPCSASLPNTRGPDLNAQIKDNVFEVPSLLTIKANIMTKVSALQPSTGFEIASYALPGTLSPLEGGYMCYLPARHLL